MWRRSASDDEPKLGLAIRMAATRWPMKEIQSPSDSSTRYQTQRAPDLLT